MGLARRSSLNTPFQTAGTIRGLPSASYYDPALATVDGQLHVVAAVGTVISTFPLDLNTLTVGTGRPLVQTANLEVNSPHPIVDSTGDMIALSYHLISGLLNDQWVAFDLNPATSGLAVTFQGSWFSNGTYLGGHYLAATNNLTYRLTGHDVLWCPGGRGSIASTIQIDSYAPATPTDVWQSALILSPAFAAPVTIPGWQGLLGVDVSTAIVLAMGPHAPTTGRASLPLAIPNQPVLSGAVVPCQAAALRAVTGQLYWANTAAITIR